jgi:AcrR family transcriptional regulator
MSAPARPKTRWGDRTARRLDILDAARRQIRTGGYLALNMRDIASGAGVSPATLYSYFATKEEIFATVYAEAIEEHNESIAPLCETADDLEEFLVDLATAYLGLYGTFGRYFSLWSALTSGQEADSPLPKELRRALRDAVVRQGILVGGTLRRLADEAGIELGPMKVVLAFLWSVLNGVGDHLYSSRHELTGTDNETLLRYAAHTIATGLAAGR